MVTDLEPIATIGTPETSGTVSMAQQSADEIEQLLTGGTWLTSGQIAVLLGRGRTTIWRRLQRGDIRSRETPGGNREWHPEDIQRLLDESRRVHGA